MDEHPMHNSKLSRGWHHVSMALLREIQAADTAHKIEVAASALFHARLVFERTARSLESTMQANCESTGGGCAMGSEPVTVICTCCEGCSCMGCPGHGRAELAAVFRRAHAAERRAAVLAALLGCAGEVAVSIDRALDAPSADPWRRPHAVPTRGHGMALLAARPHELTRLVPECKAIIAHALGAAGLTIEDLDVLEETT